MAREEIEREKKAGMEARRFSTLIRCKFVKDTLPFLGNGVLQETNDLYLLKKREQQLHIFESLIKCVLFPPLSLLIWVSTEVHNKRLN